MKLEAIKVFNPKEKMPEPGQNFLIGYRSPDGRTIGYIPATLDKYCKHEDFFDNCTLLRRLPVNCTITGWAEIFDNTPCYKIEHL